MKLNKCLSSFVSASNDIRPYIQIDLFGNQIGALLDSGASISCISGKAASDFLSKGISFKKFNPSSIKTVETAGGNKFNIIGSVVTNISFRGQTKPITIYIIPDLKQDCYLGADFWNSFGLLKMITSNLNISELTEVCSNNDLSNEQKDYLQKVIQLFPSVEKDGLGQTNVIQHSIEIQDGAKPIKQRYFNVSPAVEQKIHTEIDTMLKLGVIEEAPPTCSWSSPVTIVQKGDKLRLCLDSRKVNKVTIKDAYPQPKIDGILSRLPKANYITSLDLVKAFWQISLTVKSRDFTAFTVPNRPLYRFKVMPFGLTNAPMTMCRLMDAIIPPNLKNRVFVYLDDLLLMSTTFSEHMSLLSEVAGILRKAGLTLNIKKCKWCLKEVRYLGYIIGNGCIKTDPDKISAILNIAVPQRVKDVQSFLGLAGWYRRFIKNFSALTAPLTELTKKHKTFIWTEDCQKSFHEIKELLTTAPLLITPDFRKPFIVSCDACKTGIGGVLAQLDDEGSERPIAFYSKKLNRAQQNYSITELECLAAIKSIEKFRAYIEGLEFKVITDHASLKWLMSQSDLNGRLARWSLNLQGYNFSIEHRKGKLHIVPDSLSRLPSIEVESLDELQPLVDLNSVSFSSAEYKTLINHISENQNRLPDLKILDGFVYKRTEFDRGTNEGTEWKLWLPSDLTLDVIDRAHSPPMSAHGGIAKTLAKLRLNFFWPNMAKQVKDFVSKCEICRQCKAPNAIIRPLMGTQQKSSRPFQKIFLDFLGPYPRTKNRNIGILIILDHLTKYPLVKVVRKFSTTAILPYLEEQVFHIFGVPETVITDNGSQFRSAQFGSLLSKYGVKHVLTALYSPQANSSERVNRSIIAAIRSYLGKDQRNWDTNLNKITVALRSHLHSSIGYSPYYVLFGQQMITNGNDYQLLRNLNLEEEGTDVIQKVDKHKFIIDLVKKNLAKAYSKNKKTYDLRSRVINYDLGEKVLRRNFAQSSKADHFNAKLAPKFLKAIVLAKVGYCQYKLGDETGKECGIYHAKDIQKL